MKKLIKNIFKYFSLLCIATLATYFLSLIVTENTNLKDKIDNLNEEIVKLDSTITNQQHVIGDYQSLIDKLRSTEFKCPPTYGYVIDGRSLSAEQLLDLLLKNWDEKDSLQHKLIIQNQLLSDIEKRWGIKANLADNTYTITLTENSEIANLRSKAGSSEYALQQLAKKYAIRYELKSEGGYYEMIIPRNKIDSALMLFPYFKDRLTIEGNQYTIVR